MPRDPALQALVLALAAPRPPIVHKAAYSDDPEPDGRQQRTSGWLTDRVAHPWKRSAIAPKEKRPGFEPPDAE